MAPNFELNDRRMVQCPDASVAVAVRSEAGRASSAFGLPRAVSIARKLPLTSIGGPGPESPFLAITAWPPAAPSRRRQLSLLAQRSEPPPAAKAY